MIRFIEAADEKSRIAREILEALTDWFEVEESREQYIADSTGLPFWASVDEGINEGFLCLKETGKETMELAVMGVRKECHRKGIGRRLFAAAKDYAARKGYEFIQVKTVRSGVYEDYDVTNEFYKSLGFKELEVLPDYWDEANPCQIYVMSLKSAVNTITTRHSYRGTYLQENGNICKEETVMKKLYLHLGTPKTATTAIQYFLHNNNSKLQELGYEFPDMQADFPGNKGFAWVKNDESTYANGMLPCCDTLQVKDYSKFNMAGFDEAHKKEMREKQFPLDLEEAFQMGTRLGR